MRAMVNCAFSVFTVSVRLVLSLGEQGSPGGRSHFVMRWSDGRMGLLYRFSFIIGYLEGVFATDAPGGESYSLFTLNYMILCNYLALYGFTSLQTPS